jgi:Protein of unknown function, DUF481
MRFISAVIMLYLFSIPCSLIAQPIEKIKAIKLKHKNDLVIMENGDRNTGEIKKMEFGILHLKSDLVADTLKLDWEKVVRVQSIARYEFETIDKEFYYGMTQPDPNNEVPTRTLRILLDGGGVIDVAIPDLISIREIGQSFLSRMNIFIDAGAGYTSANSRTQSNIDFSGSFQKPKYSGTLNFSSQFSREPGAERTSRQELQITAQRVINKKWESVALGALLSDKQLDLDLRSTVGGGVERSLLETNRTLFSIIGGVVYTNENYSIDEQDRNNAEALGGLIFSTYRFRGSSLDTQVFVFPSLSDPGRLRIDADFDWKWDMILDFYWRIGFTNNYDNRPPPGGINNNFSVTTAFGWSF